jgi:hypothetical protein
VEERNKLDDYTKIMTYTYKNKLGVLVFNLIIQNKQMIQKINESTVELKKIIKEDVDVLDNWTQEKLIDEFGYYEAITNNTNKKITSNK